MSIMVCRVDGKFFGVPSEKVFKLFKVPEALTDRYTDQRRIRMQEVEVKMVDLKKVLAIEGEIAKGDRRILIVKEEGEYKGLIIAQVLQQVSATSEIGSGYGEYFIGRMPWSYQAHLLEVPILNLKRF
jgi:chemotaxis protein histidine kinase CheA